MTDIVSARVFLVLMGARKVGNALYAWGGETETEGGYDCSGFVSHVLSETNRAWPGVYTGGRTTAKGIYKHYHALGCPDIKRVDQLKPGCIVFYHDRDKRPARSATHVALHVTTVPDLHVQHGGTVVPAEVGPVAFEAGGSGSAATSPRNALKKSATVRVTATDEHGRQVWVAKDPFFHLQRIFDGEVEVDLAAATGGEPVVDVLSGATGIERAELERALRRVDMPAATRYNRARELDGTWKLTRLPRPLRDFPSDSAEFAVLVAHAQREAGFTPGKTDGKLGAGTLEAIT